MVPFIIIICFFCTIAVAKASVKDRISRFFVLSYLIYWFFSFCCSFLNPYGLYEVSDKAYFYLLLNVISFVVGFIALRIDKDYRNRELSIDKIIQHPIFLAIVIIGIVEALVLFSTRLSVLSYIDDDHTTYRADFIELVFEGNALLLYSYYLFLFPLYFFLLTLVSYMILFYRKWKLIFFFLLYLIPFMMLSEGRSQFLTFGLIMLIIYAIFGEKHRKLKVKDISLITLAAILIYASMANITANRQKVSFDEGTSLLNETFISYSIWPFRAFDYALSHDYIEKAGGYQYGRASFCGMDFLVSSFLKRFGIRYQSSRDITNGYLQGTQVPIAKDRTMNYAYTNAMYHYYDFGVIGIVIFPFMFGLFCRFIIKKYYTDKSLSLLAILSFLYFIAMHTVFSWYFNKPFTLLYILILLIVNNHTHRKMTMNKLSV